MTIELSKIKALNAHLRFKVSDVEQSIEFYKKMFGVEPVEVKTACAKFRVPNPPLNFTLNQVSPGNIVLAHLGIQLASTQELTAMRDRWIERGLVIYDEMNGDYNLAFQNKIGIHDPDGNGWQFFTIPENGFVETSIYNVFGKN